MFSEVILLSLCTSLNLPDRTQVKTCRITHFLKILLWRRMKLRRSRNVTYMWASPISFLVWSFVLIFFLETPFIFDMYLPDILYWSHDRRAHINSILSAVRSKLGYIGQKFCPVTTANVWTADVRYPLHWEWISLIYALTRVCNTPDDIGVTPQSLQYWP